MRVVITGLGVISPIGNSTSEFWNSVKEGKCGISLIESFDTEKFATKLAAEVKNFDPTQYIDPKSARRMDRNTQFAVAASKQAVEQSGLDLEKIDKERFGVIIGSGIGGMNTFEKEHKTLLEKGARRVSPFFIPMMISNMAAGNVAIQFGAKGICMSVSTACATGTNAIGEAFRAIQFGRHDIMLAGGTEASVTSLAIAGFMSLNAVSRSTDPMRASIPFDADRDGFVLGEGSGVIVMETLEHAQSRGANILAEVVGYGSTCDAFHITAPDPEGNGGARAMRQAIDEAQIDPSEVSYINAHGTSTLYNDKLESKAIRNVFGDHAYKIPVSSSKSMFGHLLGAAGAVETIVCVEALREGFVPATINYKNPDPECDLDYVPNVGRKSAIKYALSNSLGFGGHNACLAFKKWEE